MKNILINKKCFITGVTGAVGFELARLFLKNKCKLFITGKNHSKLISRYKKLKIEFPKEKIFFKQCDLYFYNEIDIELPWEPVGFTLQYTGVHDLWSRSNNGFGTISITRAF